jgi:Cu-Zn family superoxide dismutase
MNKDAIAVAVFPISGPVHGEIVCTNVRGGVEVRAVITNLPPGRHGFHIHAAGDLRGEGCKGACSHYHVGPPSDHGGAPGSGSVRHTGDLGNIEMSRGSTPYRNTYFLRGVSVEDLWGRSVIVHADEDDLGQGAHEDSRTTGHSGARIACAIFGRANGCS